MFAKVLSAYKLWHMKDIYPFLLEPEYKDYIWGGSRIPARFMRDLPGGIYAESWEVSDRPEGPSTIVNGSLAGMKLPELLRSLGVPVAGRLARDGRFPLLMKIIDAAENLSVQVHPHDSNAHLTGGEPKTEMWYVLEADEDARIYAGLKNGVTKDAFRQAIESNSLDQALNSFKAVKGDVYFIPGGRVHAIGSGCLLLELQQNSNTTYRVYDWGRVDSSGKSRPLHIEEAMRVINWNDTDSPLCKCVKKHAGDGYDEALLLDTQWFTLEKIDLRGSVTRETDGSGFRALFSESGSFSVRWDGGEVMCPMGRSCLIPAAIRNWTLSAQPGPASILCAAC